MSYDGKELGKRMKDTMRPFIATGWVWGEKYGVKPITWSLLFWRKRGNGHKNSRALLWRKNTWQSWHAHQNEEKIAN